MKKYSLIVSIFFATSLNAQGFKSVRVGELVPDIEINDIVNYPTKSIRISEFKNKLLILDFWATWCSPCIASFPKLDSLKKKFGTKLEILPVTSEQKEQVQFFLEKMKVVKHSIQASVTEDSVLEKFFKHTFLPHYVWINEGRVIAITNGEQLNEKNINKIFNGEFVSLPLKDDMKRRILYTAGNTPTFAPSILVRGDDNKNELSRISDSSLIFSSSMTKYMEGLTRGWHAYQPGLFTGRNMSILELYKVAMEGASIKSINTYPGGIIIDISDSILYNKITERNLPVKGLLYLNWIRENGYCYDLKVPAALVNQKFDIMLTDLNRYFGVLFGLEGSIEKRDSKYLALIRTTKDDKLKSKGGASDISMDKFFLNIRNKKLNSLVRVLAQPLQLLPIIIDETNYDEYIDLTLNCDLSDLNAVNKELNKYGLTLEEKHKLMDIPIIHLKK